MKIEIRHPQEIENILWAAQTITQALTALSSEPKYAAGYYQGWEEGFEKTIASISHSFNRQAALIKIWRHQDIEQFLLRERASSTGEAGDSEAYGHGFARGREAALWCCATLFGVNLFVPHKAEAATQVTNSSSRRFSQEWLVGSDITNMLVALYTTAAKLSAMAQNHPAAVDFYGGFDAGIRQIEQCFSIGRLTSKQKYLIRTATIPLWLRKDIKAKLQRLYAETQKDQQPGETKLPARTFQTGYQAALQTVASLLGLKKLT